MKAGALFKTEAELVQVYCGIVERWNRGKDRYRDDKSKWIIYPETCGFDLVVVNDTTGIQVAIEAKLSLNVQVLNQALSGLQGWQRGGPDYRAVLVPPGGTQHGVASLAIRLGLTVLQPWNCSGYVGKHSWDCRPHLPTERAEWSSDDSWFPWCPVERLQLPDYVPDVVAGVPSPKALTQWKIAAMKLVILAEKRGYVTRRDMAKLHLNPGFFCGTQGILEPAKKDGRYQTYVTGPRTLNFRAQHPVNYAQIEADYPAWSAELESKK